MLCVNMYISASSKVLKQKELLINTHITVQSVAGFDLQRPRSTSRQNENCVRPTRQLFSFQ